MTDIPFVFVIVFIQIVCTLLNSKFTLIPVQIFYANPGGEQVGEIYRYNVNKTNIILNIFPTLRCLSLNLLSVTENA